MSYREAGIDALALVIDEDDYKVAELTGKEAETSYMPITFQPSDVGVLTSTKVMIDEGEHIQVVLNNQIYLLKWDYAVFNQLLIIKGKSYDLEL